MEHTVAAPRGGAPRGGFAPPLAGTGAASGSSSGACSPLLLAGVVLASHTAGRGPDTEASYTTEMTLLRGGEPADRLVFGFVGVAGRGRGGFLFSGGRMRARERAGDHITE